MKNVAIERLRAALEEEYPPGQVTLTTHDARALLALLALLDPPAKKTGRNAPTTPRVIPDEAWRENGGVCPWGCGRIDDCIRRGH